MRRKAKDSVEDETISRKRHAKYGIWTLENIKCNFVQQQKNIETLKETTRTRGNFNVQEYSFIRNSSNHFSPT